MSEPWFFMHSGVKVGPLSEGDFRAIIQRGEVQDADPVWTRGLPNWTPLARVREQILPTSQDNPLAALGITPIDLEAGVPTLQTNQPHLAAAGGHTGPAYAQHSLAALGIAPIDLEAGIPTMDTLGALVRPQAAAAADGQSAPACGDRSLAALGIAPINLESGHPQLSGPAHVASPAGTRGDAMATLGIAPINLESSHPHLSEPADVALPGGTQGAAMATLGIAPIDLGIEIKPKSVPSVSPRSYPMEPIDRVARALFVAVAVGLAWGIRGDFGHLLGAMYPGAVLLLALAYVSGQDSALRSMPALAAASALGIGLGGNMSYGLLHGYAQSDTFQNYSYGFFALFLEGGAWGFFGGAFVGMVLERDRAKWLDWAGGIGAAIVGGLFFFWLVNQAFGFDVNPPRSNDALAHVGGALALFVWFAYRKLPIAFRGAMLGFIGFGLGMAGGRLVGNLFHNMEGMFEINHWNTMEVSCGLIGGFVFAFGMLGVRFRDRATDRPLTALDVAGALFVLGIIPLMHRVTRVDSGDVADWTGKLASFGSSWTGDSILTALNVLVALGFAGAGLWLFLQGAGKERWGAMPVLGMSFVMLLFQNFRALYFFTPAKPGYVNMHSVFWVLFFALAAYVAFREYQGGHTDDCDADEESDRVPWKPWLGVALAGFAFILLAAGAVNGEITMKNAATRWPVWQWNQPAAVESPAPSE